jgi:type IV secretory pathway VirB2 component (pilin)
MTIMISPGLVLRGRHQRQTRKRRRPRWLAPIVFVGTAMDAATAAAQDVPWGDAINRIQQDLTGPTAKAACIILICLCGIGFAASEGGGMLRKACWGVFGLTIALNAARFVAVFGG